MKILPQVLDSVVAHARESIPFESCGILLARNMDHVVCSSLRAENGEKGNPELRYELGHKAHLRAVEMEITGDVHIAGYYHSHPGGEAKPSHRDAEQALDGVTYIITAPGKELFMNTAWKLKNNRFEPEPLEMCE